MPRFIPANRYICEAKKKSIDHEKVASATYIVAFWGFILFRLNKSTDIYAAITQAANASIAAAWAVVDDANLSSIRR